MQTVRVVEYFSKEWLKKPWEKLVVNVNRGPNACPLRCDYCSVRMFEGSETVHMKPEDVRLVAEMVTKILGHEPQSIHFFGTEPLVDIDTIVAFRKYFPHAKLTVTTNGVLIDERVAKLLQEHNVIISILSLDGPYHDEHRKTRSGQGSLHLVKRAWELLPDYKYKITTLRATWLMGQDLVEFFRFGKEEFGTLNVTPIPDVINQDWDTDFVASNVERLADFLEGRLTGSIQIDTALKRAMSDKVEKRTFCGMGEIAIGPDLSIYRCHQESELVKIGDIAKDEVYPEKDALIRKWARQVDSCFQTDECRNCVAYSFCPVFGACPVQFYERTKMTGVVPENYCKVARGFAIGAMHWLSLHTREQVSTILEDMSRRMSVDEGRTAEHRR